ncbi:MAG: restriction endonuclease [Candidatus Rokuibacteriota bacterium]
MFFHGKRGSAEPVRTRSVPGAIQFRIPRVRRQEAGALQGHRARRGVFITTSSFTKDAQEFVRMIDSKIVLIDGQTLAGLMIDHNVGVSAVRSYDLKRIDSDYFSEE